MASRAREVGALHQRSHGPARVRRSTSRASAASRPGNTTIVHLLDKRGELRIPLGEHYAPVPLLAGRKGLSFFPPLFGAFAILRCVPGVVRHDDTLNVRHFYIQKPKSASHLALPCGVPASRPNRPFLLRIAPIVCDLLQFRSVCDAFATKGAPPRSSKAGAGDRIQACGLGGLR
jgi:hypothetical protein